MLWGNQLVAGLGTMRLINSVHMTLRGAPAIAGAPLYLNNSWHVLRPCPMVERKDE